MVILYAERISISNIKITKKRFFHILIGSGGEPGGGRACPRVRSRLLIRSFATFDERRKPALVFEDQPGTSKAPCKFRIICHTVKGAVWTAGEFP